MSRWRINYGNGQVSQVFPSRNAARQELHDCCFRNETYVGFYFIQFYDAGAHEWRAAAR